MIEIIGEVIEGKGVYYFEKSKKNKVLEFKRDEILRTGLRKDVLDKNP